MTQEEKSLLLQDLSARLPYGVICKRYENAYELVDIDIKRGLVYLLRNEQYVPYSIISGDEIKPCLRPLSSMTDEERTEIDKLNRPQGGDWVVQLSRGNTGLYNNFSRVVLFKSINKVLDYLNAHHFDYRGLIEKGLAIEI